MGHLSRYVRFLLPLPKVGTEKLKGRCETFCKSRSFIFRPFWPRSCDLFLLVVCGAEVISSYEWFSIMSNPWRQLTLVLGDILGYFHVWGYLYETNFLILLLACFSVVINPWDILGYLHIWDYVTNILVIFLACCIFVVCGALLRCHLLRVFLFSAIIWRSSLEFCFYLVLLAMLHFELLWLCFRLLLLYLFQFLGVSPRLFVNRDFL